MVAACRLRRDVRRHRRGHRVSGSGPLSGPLIATILADCRPTLKLPRLIHGGGLMLLQYGLGFELRRSDLLIMAASVALVVLIAFSF